MKLVLFSLLLILLSHLSFTSSATPSNPRQLVHAALSTSALQTSKASTYVSGLSSGKSPHGARTIPNAFKDCSGMMAHSADRLRMAVEEMRLLGPIRSPRYTLHVSNLQTWVSSALTDQDMCIATLGRGGGQKMEACKKVVAGARGATSHALSLVNQLN